MTYPIDHGAIYNIILMDYEETDWKEDQWIVPWTVEKLHKRLSGWGETGHKLIDVSPQCRNHTLFSMLIQPLTISTVTKLMNAPGMSRL